MEARKLSTEQSSKLAIYEGKHIRKSLHQGELWFSIIDVINVLVGGDRPRKYWNDLKKKLISEGYSEVSEKIEQSKIEPYEKIVRLKMIAAEAIQHLTDSLNRHKGAVPPMSIVVITW